MDFQVVSIEGQDIDGEYMITLYGRTRDGKSIGVTTPFRPYFFIRVDKPLQQLRSELTEMNMWHQKRDCTTYFLSMTMVDGIDVWGFRNSEKSRFIRVEFLNVKRMRSFASSCRYKKLKTYENQIDPVLRFMHCTGIQSTGWVHGVGIEAELTTCDIDRYCRTWSDLKPVDDDSIAPLRITSFDIETYSSTGKFPDPMIPDDVAFQVAFTTKVYGSLDPPVQKCFCLKETPGHEWFHTEKEMLMAVSKYIRDQDFDILTGWNIFGFDLEYLYRRMEMTKCPMETFYLGRKLNEPSLLVYKTLASSALGENVLKMVPMPGRFVFDLFQTIKAGYKLDSYSLNNVSKEFLGDSKLDMPIKEMFEHYRTGNAAKLGEVADYCMKDTELPIQIMEKLFTVENLIEMAKATWVPMNYLVERGQQIKVFSQVAKKARELGFMIPYIDKPKVASEYEGATVLDACTGAYYKPITALDFASLYPSIMVAHNLCYSTLVMDPRYDNIPGIEYETHGGYRFAQNVPSLLPVILTDLRAFRKKAKKDMEAAKGTHMYPIYDGKQLAYKISMNSVYGFTGATNGILPCLAIASTVTAQGRTMIQMSKEYVERHFEGAQVRYGDSVMPGTPVLTQNGPVCIENLDTNWIEYPGFLKEGIGKEQCELSGVRVWTSSGWSDVKRVIRHKCQKKIYRVLTHTGLVDVTEDHSLLGPNKELLKPKDVTLGTELCHGFPDEVICGDGCTTDQAYIYGMFVGDGSCGVYGPKFSWAINNSDHTLLEKCQHILENIHGKEFKILETLESSGVYKLVPHHNDIKSYVLKYRQECYDDQCKKVPLSVLSSHETRQAFLRGLWDSDGCRKDLEKIGCHRIDTKNQITAQWYYILLRQLGYSVSLNTREDKSNVFRLTWTESSQRRNPYTIKKLSLLHENYDGYVYDLETSDGTFQAGVGQLIVKNTDSIMVEFDTGDRTGKEAIEYSWELGARASKEITELFKKPNELELEKVYCPYFLYSKKRYAAKMWVRNKKGEMEMEKIDVKGLQVVRRDTCEFVRHTCQTALNKMLDMERPDAYVEERKEMLLDGRVAMGELVLSKRLGDSYKSSNLAHVAVRDKIRERAPGSEPRSGDRVQFVLVDTGDKKAKMYQKAEDPVYVQTHGLPIDYGYYYKHQFLTPVRELTKFST